MPQVRILDNLELGSEDYRILVKEVDAGRGTLRPQLHLAMDPSGTAPAIAGEKVKEPVFGLPAVWIDDTQKENATFHGYTVVDAATVLTTHFTELVKENMAELLTFADVKKLIEDLPKAQRTLVDDITPGQITVSGIQRVLQNLLRERISIRDFGTILEAIAEATAASTDLLAVTEHVRTRLARQLCNTHLDVKRRSAHHRPVAQLGAGVRRSARRRRDRSASSRWSPRGCTSSSPTCAAPSSARRRRAMRRCCSPRRPVRPYVRSLVERFRPQTIVMSQNEIHPKARLRSAGAV